MRSAAFVLLLGVGPIFVAAYPSAIRCGKAYGASGVSVSPVCRVSCLLSCRQTSPIKKGSARDAFWFLNLIIQMAGIQSDEAVKLGSPTLSPDGLTATVTATVADGSIGAIAWIGDGAVLDGPGWSKKCDRALYTGIGFANLKTTLTITVKVATDAVTLGVGCATVSRTIKFNTITIPGSGIVPASTSPAYFPNVPGLSKAYP